MFKFVDTIVRSSYNGCSRRTHEGEVSFGPVLVLYKTPTHSLILSKEGGLKINYVGYPGGSNNYNQVILCNNFMGKKLNDPAVLFK